METGSNWWLLAGERVFGPYEASQLAGFLQQGRLATESRMARSPQGPFTAAGDWPELGHLFRAPAAHPAHPAPAAERTLVVLAALRETPAEALDAALLSFGPAVRVRGTLWGCRARLPAAGLRNALSRRLGAGEFLFVAEVQAADAAWFNLDAEADRALRRLWG